MHPYLASRVRVVRYVGTPVLAAVGAVFIALEIHFDFTAYGQSLAFGLLFVGLAGFQYRRCVRWAARADWVLETIPAVPMRVTFSTAESGSTALLAPVPSGEPLAIDIETPDWNVRRLEGTVVQVHADPDVDGLVIIRTDAGLLWPHDQYRRVPAAQNLEGGRGNLSLRVAAGILLPGSGQVPLPPDHGEPVMKE